ncbi:uncharacterized protein LOC127429730 isoform X2 [Myxocyprinus asiaticus]|uniref:uncharacterized protein LOC127429730 isoform X2 n=1 Tax=Myxocyprinus asiaticus TaxID=70543 RepID=UPI0022222DCC|nr:uncharacterized protein LOC127429730 isoform X2 [Myxocyprinus asiaticus]
MAIKILIIKPSPFEPQVFVANKVLQNKTSPLSTPFSKSQNIVTTDATFILKLLAISKKSSSESIFLNHSTTGKIGLPLGDKQQDLKNQKATEGLFVGSHTVSSVPSVQEHIEPQPGEVFVTATLQSQSRAQTESYLKKRNDTVKLTTLKHSDHSSGSVVSMNQTSLMSILPKIVTLSQNILPIHSTSVSPVVYLTSGFNQHLTFSALLETSTSVEQAMTQTSATHFTVQPIAPTESGGKDNHKDSLLSHQGFANSTDVKEYAQNMASSQISGITELQKRHTVHTTAAAQTEAALNTSAFPFSPLESSTAATSPTLPLFLFRMQTVLHKDSLTLTKNQTEFFTTRKEQSQMAQPNFLSDKMSSSGTTEDIQKHLGQNALSAVTGKKLSRSVYTDLSSTSTETESVPQGSLQSRGGSENVSDNTTSFAENDSTEFLSDLPLIKRKRRITSPDSLSGLAHISDDICGTGNYTAEMSLNLERDIMPGDLIPALGNLLVVITLKTNNSQVNLKIKSCCLSPTVRLDEFNTTCCIFSRPPIDPHGIRLLSSVLSKRASFTISLFQMINYSTAYLHCDLSVCLRNHSECRKSVQHRNTHPVEEAGAILGSTGNRISFGPLLKGMDNSSFSETAADMEAAVVIISSVASCLLVCLALMLVWMANRRCLEKSAYCWSRALCDC